MADRTTEPWSLEDEGDLAEYFSRFIDVADADGRSIGLVFSDDDGPTGRQWADARLIAAAPVMYAELRRLEWRVVDCLGAACPSCDRPESEGHRDDCALAALIALVEGPAAR